MEQTLLTVDEVASLLRVSRRSVYEMTSAPGRERMMNTLPVLRLGSAICLGGEDIVARINRQKEVV
jgi:excisionase family DNA binding protein